MYSYVLNLDQSTELLEYSAYSLYSYILNLDK